MKRIVLTVLCLASAVSLLLTACGTMSPSPRPAVSPSPAPTVSPAPAGTSSPAPEGTVSPAPEGTQSPAPEGTTSPAPEGTVSPAPNSPSPSAGGLSGPLTEVVRRISDTASEQLGENGIGMVFERDITTEDSGYILGVAPENFTANVQSAAVSEGMLAHLSALIQCKDEAAAKEMKRLIADGFDPAWMVCVTAEKCVVVESGVYVYLAASTSAACDALIESFEAAAGSIGEPDAFHLGIAGGDGPELLP